jgi:hypothetical protein
MYIVISEKIVAKVFISLLIMISCLMLVGVVAVNHNLLPEPLSKLFFILDQQGDGGTISMLDINSEASISNWFSSSALLFCSVLLINIASFKQVTRDRYAAYWKILALVFLFMSLDEAVSLHEKAISPLQSALNVGGFFYFAWVIPGIAFVAIFVLMYLRFFLDLPTKTKWLFAASGAIYVGGALGVELLEGLVYPLDGYSIAYVAVAHIQESLEMLGIVIFVYVLMRYTASLSIATQASQRVPSLDRDHIASS